MRLITAIVALGIGVGVASSAQAAFTLSVPLNTTVVKTSGTQSVSVPVTLSYLPTDLPFGLRSVDFGLSINKAPATPDLAFASYTATLASSDTTPDPNPGITLTLPTAIGFTSSQGSDLPLSGTSQVVATFNFDLPGTIAEGNSYTLSFSGNPNISNGNDEPPVNTIGGTISVVPEPTSLGLLALGGFGLLRRRARRAVTAC